MRKKNLIIFVILDEQNGQNNSHRNSSLTNINAMSFKEKYEEQFQIGKFRKHSPNNSTLNLNRPISYAGLYIFFQFFFSMKIPNTSKKNFNIKIQYDFRRK